MASGDHCLVAHSAAGGGERGAGLSAAVARLAEADACGGVVTTMSLAALTQAEE
jgi:hypothetical protein